MSIQRLLCSCCVSYVCASFICLSSVKCVFLMSRLPSLDIICVISALWWCFVSHVLMLNIPCFPYKPCPLTLALIFCPVTVWLSLQEVCNQDISPSSQPLPPLSISCNLHFILSWLSFKAFLLPVCRHMYIVELLCSNWLLLGSEVSVVHMVRFIVTPPLYCLALDTQIPCFLCNVPVDLYTF